MQQLNSKIISNTQIAESFFKMDFSWESPLIPSPGNFLTLRVSQDSTPLLRRPFAFSGFDKYSSTCSIIYQKRGRGTEILAGKQEGETIDVIGPLGKEFPLPQNATQAILVAGGIGIGPMLFLAAHLRSINQSFTFVFGCRKKSFIPDTESFWSLDPVICTDDGSSGFKGTTAAYLDSIDSAIENGCTIYCCGPHPMLKACHETSEAKNGLCYVSVEQIMACGVGACMGCVVKTKADPGYARACKEGPVFKSTDLLW